jgi:threonine dehydrogenase-like Zn-dependent dehydrogenase
VRVAVAFGGICGSDLHYFHRGAVGDFKVREPMALGHEISGVVLEAGAYVAGITPRMEAALDPSRPCLSAHDEFRLAVRLITSGTIDVAPILSGTYPMSQAATALELAGDRTRFVRLHLAL